MKVDIYKTTNRYEIIYADPPWTYKDRGCNGAAAKQYNLMKEAEIKNLPVEKLADKNCVLFMWTTYPKLPEALEVIKAWGFIYKSIGFQWIKQNKSGIGYHFGLGRWTRGNTECCLLATKGKPKRKSAGVSQLIFAPIARHSQKPGAVREKITELMGDLPRIELFARETCDGWDCWGDEV